VYISNLKCSSDHVFEGWFDTRTEMHEGLKASTVKCAECGSTEVEPAPNAPRVKTDSRTVTLPLQKKIAGLRQHIFRTHDDVGERLAETARAIHDGKEPERPLMGVCSEEESKALHEDKIGLMIPLPPMMDIEKN
jgi:hypothetical protein